ETGGSEQIPHRALDAVVRYRKDGSFQSRALADMTRSAVLIHILAVAFPAHKVICSMGALVIPPDGSTHLDEFMREADRLMYAAKRNGKNAIQFAACAPPL